MTSDEERRELAAKLRGIESYDMDGEELCDCAEVEGVLGLVSDDGAWYQADGVRKLAGLIDRPMTRNLSEKPEFVCELCGAVWPYDLGFTHCPECGAEVDE